MNKKNSFDFITQAINKTLSIIEWVWVFGIAFQVMYESNKLIYIFIDRAGLPNLK